MDEGGKGRRRLWAAKSLVGSIRNHCDAFVTEAQRVLVTEGTPPKLARQEAYETWTRSPERAALMKSMTASQARKRRLV